MDGAQLALQTGDYERAAVHIRRYLDMDPQLLATEAAQSQFTGQPSEIVTAIFFAAHLPTSPSSSLFHLTPPLCLLAGPTPSDILDAARSRLTEIVQQSFAQAANSKDNDSVLRFVKLFPLLKLHAEGVAAYGRYLCSQLSRTMEEQTARAVETDAPDTAFVDTLTALFEHVAQTVRQQEPLIETHYGEAITK